MYSIGKFNELTLTELSKVLFVQRVVIYLQTSITNYSFNFGPSVYLYLSLETNTNCILFINKKQNGIPFQWNLYEGRQQFNLNLDCSPVSALQLNDKHKLSLHLTRDYDMSHAPSIKS